PEVHLVTDEGRSFVRRSTEKYDAIISVNTISNAAMASGALSLSENYVLTREAFRDYLDHLTPEGVIFFSRPEFQIPRLVSTAREVFAEQGLGSINDHVLAFSNFKRRNWRMCFEPVTRNWLQPPMTSRFSISTRDGPESGGAPSSICFRKVSPLAHGWPLRTGLLRKSRC